MNPLENVRVEIYTNETEVIASIYQHDLDDEALSRVTCALADALRNKLQEIAGGKLRERDPNVDMLPHLQRVCLKIAYNIGEHYKKLPLETKTMH